MSKYELTKEVHSTYEPVQHHFKLEIWKQNFLSSRPYFGDFLVVSNNLLVGHRYPSPHPIFCFIIRDRISAKLSLRGKRRHFDRRNRQPLLRQQSQRLYLSSPTHYRGMAARRDRQRWLEPWKHRVPIQRHVCSHYPRPQPLVRRWPLRPPLQFYSVRLARCPLSRIPCWLYVHSRHRGS